jgi:hypothetical protein
LNYICCSEEEFTGRDVALDTPRLLCTFQAHQRLERCIISITATLDKILTLHCQWTYVLYTRTHTHTLSLSSFPRLPDSCAYVHCFVSLYYHPQIFVIHVSGAESVGLYIFVDSVFKGVRQVRLCSKQRLSRSSTMGHT